MHRTSTIGLSILLLSLAVVSHAAESPSDPFLGDWQGGVGGPGDSCGGMPTTRSTCCPNSTKAQTAGRARGSGDRRHAAVRPGRLEWPGGRRANDGNAARRRASGGFRVEEGRPFVADRRSQTARGQARSSCSTAPTSTKGKPNPRRTPAPRSPGSCVRISMRERPPTRKTARALADHQAGLPRRFPHAFRIPPGR